MVPLILARVNLHVAAVEPTTEGNWRLRDVRYETDSVGLRCEVIEIPSGLGYLWARFWAEDMEMIEVRANRIEVQLKAPAKKIERDPSQLMDPVEGVGVVGLLIERVEPWLPVIEVNVLSLRAADNDVLLKGSGIRVSAGTVTGQFASAMLPERIWVEATVKRAEPWRILVEAPKAGIHLKGILREGNGGFRIEGILAQGEDRVEGYAIYVVGDRLPVEGSLQSDGFTLDVRWLPRKENWQLVDARLSKLFLSWENGAYAATLQSKAVFVGSEGGPIPLDTNVSLSGNLETIEIEKCAISAGWGYVHLSQPVKVGLKDYRVAQDTQLSVHLDLAKQPFISATGVIDARVSVVGSMDVDEANVQFDLKGKGLGYAQFKAEQIEGSGTYRGSELSLTALFIRPSDGDVIKVTGETDFTTGMMDLSYVAAVGADWVNEWMGKRIFVGRLTGEGRIGGNFECPEVEGVIDSVTYQGEWADPIEIAGTFYSMGRDEIEASVRMNAGGALIETVLAASMSEGLIAVELDALRWSDPEYPELALEAPVRIRYAYGDATMPMEARISVDPFRFLGTDLEIKGQWNSLNGLALSFRNVSLLRVNRWIKEDLSGYSLKEVDLVISEWKPYLMGTANLFVENEIDETVRFGLDLRSHFGEEGVVVDALNIHFSEEQLLSGVITFPLRFQVPASGSRYWALVDQGTFEGKVTGSSNVSISAWLKEETGIQIGNAELDLEIKGKLEDPIGSIVLRIDSIKSGLFSMPSLNEVAIMGTVQSGVIEVSHFGFNTNQNNAASGTLLLPVKALIAAIKGEGDARKELYSQSSGSVELNDWKVENWVDQLPSIMRQSGQLSGSLELRPGLDLSGDLVFEDFALRPTPTFPSIDKIGGEVTLANRMFTVKHATARVLESSVAFEGWLNAENEKAFLWNFRLSGENVPLVRTTDMILRSDLDIRVQREEASSLPLVSGDLNLRSSTLLVAFDPLAPSLESGPRRKPPFFAITEPTIANWRFDLAMNGDSFMRVRSPYFRTELSANLTLGGSFSEPELVGSIRTVNGELRFPGSRMSIENGEAHIAPDRLDALQLNLRGTTQKASYVVTMEVTQTLDDPHVSFQSSPPLPNAAIIRLLATGSTTGGGVGTVGLYLGQGLLGAGGMDDRYADRLTIDVGAETSRSGRNTVGARLELTEDLYLNGEYDVYDAYNLDLVWSIYRE